MKAIERELETMRGLASSIGDEENISEAVEELSQLRGVFDKPVGYEYRSGRGDYAWSDWERLTPRNPFTESVEDSAREIQDYIVRGYRYELRALYAGPVPDDVLMPSNAGGNATERSEGRVDHNVGRHTEE